MINTPLNISLSLIYQRIIAFNLSSVFNPPLVKSIIDFNKFINELFIYRGNVVDHIIFHYIFQILIISRPLSFIVL